MVKHERNDPRRGEREAAEKARQNRLSTRLLLAIALLALAVLAVWGVQSDWLARLLGESALRLV